MESMQNYMPQVNSLASTMWPGALSTDENDADNDTDDENADDHEKGTQLHKLSWPLARSAKMELPWQAVYTVSKYPLKSIKYTKHAKNPGQIGSNDVKACFEKHFI